MDLTDLVPFVLPEVPGAAPNEVALKIREAFRTFCMDTESWRQNILVDVVTDQASYSTLPQGEARIRRVLEIKVKSKETDSFDNINPVSLDYIEVDSDSLGFRFLSGHEPIVTITDGMQVKVALQPTRLCESVDDDLIDRFAEAIYSKAKALLMRMPGKMFYNAELSRFYDSEYARYKASAYAEVFTKKRQQDIMVIQLGGRL